MIEPLFERLCSEILNQENRILHFGFQTAFFLAVETFNSSQSAPSIIWDSVMETFKDQWGF